MLLKLVRPLVFFDLETTGLDTAADRIVEAGFVKLLPDGSREELVERVDPGIDIPDGAAKVHGIRTEDVRGLFGKPRLGKIAHRFVEFIGDGDLAGFNSIQFDLPLWRAECERYEIPFEFGDRHHVDAKVIFNTLETGWDRFLMGPRNLSNAVRHYCGRNTFEGAHGAEVDTGWTADVLLAQLERYPDLPRDVPGLAQWCTSMLRERNRTQETS